MHGALESTIPQGVINFSIDVTLITNYAGFIFLKFMGPNREIGHHFML